MCRRLDDSSGMTASIVRAIAPLMVAALATGGSIASGSHGDTSRSAAHSPALSREAPFVTRDLAVSALGEGALAIAYGPYREGQRPGGAEPTTAEIREDLGLIADRWRLIRVYGSTGPTERILEVIRADSLDLRVMLGVWIEDDVTSGAADSTPVAVGAANRLEIDTACRLANAYPDIVAAVNVGNETQVSWSNHRIPASRLVDHVREVRARVSVPVTVADDFNFWNKPGSRAIADELDFIVVHAHPLWNGRRLGDAMAWTTDVLAEVRALHPTQRLVLGETGWATRKHDEGEQARLIRGTPSEDAQAMYYDALRAWVGMRHVVCFYFEAFDEPWKGGSDPDDVEKHWGLFRADRTPKRALSDDR